MSELTVDRGKARLKQAAKRMVHATVLERIAIAIGSTALALLIGALIVWASGYDPLEFLVSLGSGAFGNATSFTLMLRQSTMLILAGLAVAIAFQAGVFNIGVQGQFVVGGFATTLTILYLAPVLPSGSPGGILLILLGTLAAMAGGGAYAAIPGLMKAYADANEIITTIMLNFIANGVVFYLVVDHLKPPGANGATTAKFPEYVSLPAVVFNSPSFSMIAFGAVLVAVLVVYFIMNRTRFGYDMVTSGFQQSAARYSGVNSKRTMVRTMVFSGMVAGLVGAIYAIMILGFYTNPNTFETFGFDGIAVSLLAANNPLGVIPAGLLFGGLDAGKQYIGFTTNIPAELVEGITGIVILFVATPELFRMAGHRLASGGEER